MIGATASQSSLENRPSARTGAIAKPGPWVPIGPVMRLGILGVLLLYTLVCILGALINSSQNSAGPLLAFSDFVYLAVVAYPLLRYKPKTDGWFHPLVFSTLWIMVRMLPRRAEFFIYGLEEHAVLPLSTEELTKLVAYENLLNALALVCTYAGFYAIKRPWMPRLRLRPRATIWLRVACTAVFSAIALAIYIRLSGSLTQHFINLSLNATAKVFEDEVSGVGHLITAAQLFPVALIVALGYRPAVVRKPWFWAAALLAVVMVYLATGKRSMVLSPILVGSISWMLVTRRVPLLRMALAGVITAAAFVGLTLVRGAATNAKSFADVTEAMSDFEATSAISNSAGELAYRLGGYSSVYPILHYVPNESPLLWGETYLVIVGRPIPRTIWPLKPRGTDFRAGATFFGAVWGIPPGAMAEAYWNFHIPGVIGVFFLYGIFCRWISNLYLAHPADGIVAYLYAYTLLNFTPTENVITNWLQTVLLVGGVAMMIGAIRLNQNGS